MEFRTIVNLPEKRLQLTPSSKVLLLGSCFTEHIGQHMTEALPSGHADSNPYGILYNPGSIFTALQDLIFPEIPLPDDTFFAGKDGWWHNWRCSGDLSAANREECEARITKRRQAGAQLLRDADALFITFSTDHCYYLLPDCRRSSLVANCHKEPSRRFTEADFPFSALLEEGRALLRQLQESLPKLTVVFTLSPYRYRKYGLHESQLSKARLLHAIDLLCQEQCNALYFPAYEIVVDELRDYRFYAPDMLHPSEQATDYVWERFREWAFSPQLQAFAQEKAALVRDFKHRPLHPESEAAARFLQQREARKQAFLEKWKTTW